MQSSKSYKAHSFVLLICYINDPALIERIRIDPTIANNFITSKNFFLGFLSRNDQWQRHHNHNQLRITRIIKSLLLFVSREEAESFHQNVLSLVNSNALISTKAYDYWSLALGDKPKTQAC